MVRTADHARTGGSPWDGQALPQGRDAIEVYHFADRESGAAEYLRGIVGRSRGTVHFQDSGVFRNRFAAPSARQYLYSTFDPFRPPKGDRVKITMNGKFFPYKKW